MDRIGQYLSKDKKIRVSIANCTQTAARICQLNSCMPPAATFLGRVVSSGVLLATHLPSDDWLQMTFDGNGPLQRVWCRVHSNGEIFARCPIPDVPATFKNGKLDVSQLIGIGLLHVDISHAGKSPYRGTVHIATGEVGEDIAFYLDQSQQIPSVISIGVHMDKNGVIDAAGGILIELMPGHDESHIKSLEQNLKKVDSATTILATKEFEKGFLEQFLFGIECEKLEHDMKLRINEKGCIPPKTPTPS